MSLVQQVEQGPDLILPVVLDPDIPVQPSKVLLHRPVALVDLNLKSQQEEAIGSTVTASTSTGVRKGSDGADPLPVYWINLEKSVERRHAMETMFSLIDDWGNFVSPNRLPAVDISQTLEMLEKETLIMNGTKLVPKNGEQTWKKHLRNEYLYSEAACLLSHLTAILQAYNDGHEMVLILEDDQVLTTQFLLNWKIYADLAPTDWTALQWITSKEVLLQQGKHIDEPWINWQPDSWCAGAYLLNREGMKRILKKTYDILPDGGSRWSLTEPGLLVADELVYFLAENSYSSTTPRVFILSGVASVVGNRNNRPSEILKQAVTSYGNKDASSLTQKAHHPVRPESILVLSNMRLTSEAAISAEFERLRVDVEALSTWHKNSKWILNVVITNENLMVHLEQTIVATALPTFVHLQVKVYAKRYNKFAFLKPLVEEMVSFDYVLLIDSDQRLAGFPWNTFMEQKGDALISGPLRQAKPESLMRSKHKRQRFQFHDSLQWKHRDIKWSTELFESVTPLAVPLIEMYFALLPGDFGEWFFSQILTDEFLNQLSSWGPDLMWCGAAKDYNSTRTACNLVPVVSLHDETRQIAKSTPQEHERHLKSSHQVLDGFRNNTVFGKWMSKSDKWVKLIVDAKQAEIMKRCKLLLHSEDFDIRKCISIAQDGGSSTILREDQGLER
jgi:GR25 family glycosyltransferase involved in LPS biosynthesis